MIDLGSTHFYFSRPQFSKSALEDYSLLLFDQWELEVEQGLLLPDYSLLLEVEEGSIRGKGRVAASLAAVYMGIAGYGSFVSGLKTIKEQVVTVGNYLVEEAQQRLGGEPGSVTVNRRGETLGSLHRLFIRVQRGEISPEQAMMKAERLLGENASESAEFMDELANSLKQTPKYPEQIGFAMDGFEIPPSVGVIQDVSDVELPVAPRPPVRPTSPSLSHMRVEVWRESKKQKKRIRTSVV